MIIPDNAAVFREPLSSENKARIADYREHGIPIVILSAYRPTLRDVNLGRSREPGPAPGDLYDGPVCFCDDPELVDQPGYYALDEDGKELRSPLLRLASVQHDQSTEHYYVVAGPDDRVTLGRIVPLEAELEGHGSVEAG